MSVGERTDKTKHAGGSAPAPTGRGTPEQRSPRTAPPVASPPAAVRESGELFGGEDDDGLRWERVRPGTRLRLPHPAHSADCLYYVLSGEIRGAGRTRAVGDGFLVRAGHSSVFTAGHRGAELLELRTAARYDADDADHVVDRWTRIGGALAARRHAWQPRRQSPHPRPGGGTRPGDA